MPEFPDDLPKLFRVHVLNDEVQKNILNHFVAENVRIGPTGVLECDRVYNDVPEKEKIFYKGEFFIEEMDKEDSENFRTPPCEHDHED